MTRPDCPVFAVPGPDGIPVAAPSPAPVAWQTTVPRLVGRLASLRELEPADAPALRAVMSAAEVARFISPAPPTLAGFQQFIAAMQHARRSGTYVCFAVVPHGATAPVGLFQLRALDQTFATAEWGFVISPAFWGSGLFLDAAAQVLDFAFATLGAHRLEARAAVMNGRGNGALRKLGAVQEAVLRRSFPLRGGYVDQVLWAIVRDDWRDASAAAGLERPVH